MEQTLSSQHQAKILEYRHISSATGDIVKYIRDRKYRKTKSLATRWKKFNSIAMGGVEPNCIYTIAGISGSGDVVLFKNIAVYTRNRIDNYRANTGNAEMQIPW